MSVWFTMGLMPLTIICAFGFFTPSNAESSVHEEDVEHVDYEEDDSQNPHQKMMMERQDKLMKMEPIQERRDEMIENHKNKMMDPQEIERREEIIAERQISLGDHADRMKNKPQDEESPNPGEPVIP